MAIILAADDSSTIRKLVKFTLQMKKHEVILAEDGLDAYNKFNEYDIDIIVTDLNMPKMTGIELIEKIRSGHKKNDIPIVLLTTESDENDIQMGKKAGVNSYMLKPFQPNDLIKEVEKYI